MVWFRIVRATPSTATTRTQQDLTMATTHPHDLTSERMLLRANHGGFLGALSGGLTACLLIGCRHIAEAMYDAPFVKLLVARR